MNRGGAHSRSAEEEAAAATKIAINSNYFHKGKEKEVPGVSKLADVDDEDHEPYHPSRPQT